MKDIYREDYRVKVLIRPTNPRHVGLGGVAAKVVSGPVEVVLAPDPMPYPVRGDRQETYRLRAEEIAQMLRWHDEIVSAVVTFKETITCSHCRSVWEDATDDPAYLDCFTESGDGPGMPVCCEAAQVEWRAAQAAVIA